MRIRSIIATTVAAGAVAVVLAGCGPGTTGEVTAAGSGTPASGATTAPAKGGPTTGRAGDTITITDGETTVALTVGKPATAAQAPGELGIKAEKGVFVTVKVTADVTAGKYHANPFNFALVAADGARYTTTVGWFDPALTGVDLVAGRKTTGNITFDVPQAVLADGSIEVTGLGLSGLSKAAAAWTL